LDKLVEQLWYALVDVQREYRRARGDRAPSWSRMPFFFFSP
jgi:hypothetical protein